MNTKTDREIRISRYSHYKEKNTLELIIKIVGWGHVKGNNIYIGRNRARCTYLWPGTLKGDVKCGRKISLDDVGIYSPHTKEIMCKTCSMLKHFHEAMEDNIIVIIDKKSVEELIIDSFLGNS